MTSSRPARHPARPAPPPRRRLRLTLRPETEERLWIAARRAGLTPSAWVERLLEASPQLRQIVVSVRSAPEDAAA